MYQGRYLYHATDAQNVDSITRDETLFRGVDNCVYLAETEEEALRFMQFRWDVETLAVFRIDMRRLRKRKLKESFDHSFQFFQCRAWLYEEDIPKKALNAYKLYERTKKEGVQK